MLMSSDIKIKVMKKRGRPVGSGKVVKKFKPELVKMSSVKFDEGLFVPMRTNRKIDQLFSSEGGVMKGCNYAIIGDPGVGKSTVMLDVLSELNKGGSKTMFISGEMTSIDLYGYVKRYPKFGDLPILFLGDYHDHDPIAVIKSALHEGFDCVLIDSMAEVCTAVVDYHGGTMKAAESKILTLLETHNKAENKEERNTTFLIIQQVTKSGQFAGSNRFKHMLTGMAEIRFGMNGRFIEFSKNRRGGQMDRLYFSLDQMENVGWLYTEPKNQSDDA
jgi:DNA repair protein RadA/Sms